MKYLAWAVSGVPEFQLKLSIRPCQALSLKYLFLWRPPPKGAAVCWFHLALCSGVGTRQCEECHCLPHTASAQGLFRPVHVSGLGRAWVWKKALSCLRDWLSPGQRGENRASGKCRTWCVIKNSFCSLGHLVQCWRPIPLFLGNNTSWLLLF